MKRKAGASKLVRLGGKLFRLELVKRAKVSEVERAKVKRRRKVKRRKGRR